MKNFYLIIALVVFTWVGYLLAVFCIFNGDWQTSGQFGDSFGALNTLFTGGAFVVVLATLRLQSQQIAEMKQDFEKERALQVQTAEFVATQAKALATQAQFGALTARIEAYHVQIQDSRNRGAINSAIELEKERHNLLVKLDEVLKKTVV